MAKEYKYLFGPVPSRRLGLSLGIDIVPFKICTLDCVYCELGITTDKIITRGEYVDLDAVLAELKQKIQQGLDADYITISGSGEPTLNKSMGKLITEIKKVTDIPVAILTNATLFDDPDVRADCRLADVVLPSLDAAEQSAFEKINRPHTSIDVEKIIAGLIDFRSEFSGLIWLEIFFIDGINTDNKQVLALKTAVDKIKPDIIHLNTAVRPTAEKNIRRVEKEKLDEIARVLGPNAQVIADFDKAKEDKSVQIKAEDVFALLKRRPCSLDDICSGLGLHKNEAIKYVTQLLNAGQIIEQEMNKKHFYLAKT